jgi:uracil-DNA glycosylase family 4
MIEKKIYKLFKTLNLDNPLDFARKIVAPLCKEKLNEHILSCKDCNTCNSCEKKTPIGNPNANILIINDNATDNEEINNYTMNILETAGIDMRDVYMINSVSCILKRDFNGETIVRLPNRKEVKNCKHFVDYAIDFVKPRVIILMGATSLSMYRSDITLEEIKGQYIEVNGIKAMVTYSAKDLFSMLEYYSEDEVYQTAEQVAEDVANTLQYLKSLERR